MNLDDLLNEMSEKIRNRDLSDEYLREHNNSTREEIGIGEYAYGITMIPCEWVYEYLSDYKRVLKENEELKSKNKTLEELLQGNLYELHKYYKELAGTYQENCILVQEVTDKIEKEIKYHEKNILDIENTTMLKGKTTKEEAEIEFNKYAIVVLKKMLQELLEGRK